MQTLGSGDSHQSKCSLECNLCVSYHTSLCFSGSHRLVKEILWSQIKAGGLISLCSLHREHCEHRQRCLFIFISSAGCTLINRRPPVNGSWMNERMIERCSMPWGYLEVDVRQPWGPMPGRMLDWVNGCSKDAAGISHEWEMIIDGCSRSCYNNYNSKLKGNELGFHEINMGPRTSKSL